MSLTNSRRNSLGNIVIWNCVRLEGTRLMQIIEQDTEFLVAQTPLRTVNFDSTIDDANARLIAAAPEMLDALIALTAHSAQFPGMPRKHAKARALKAIAKATQP